MELAATKSPRRQLVVFPMPPRALALRALSRLALPIDPRPQTPLKNPLISHASRHNSLGINTSENFSTSRISLILNDFNPCRINTSETKELKSFIINTSKTKDLKSFRINTSKKQGRGYPPPPQALFFSILPRAHTCPEVLSPSDALQFLSPPSRRRGSRTR
jgi:hypothetical protein